MQVLTLAGKSFRMATTECPERASFMKELASTIGSLGFDSSMYSTPEEWAQLISIRVFMSGRVMEVMSCMLSQEGYPWTLEGHAETLVLLQDAVSHGGPSTIDSAASIVLSFVSELNRMRVLENCPILM